MFFSSVLSPSSRRAERAQRDVRVAAQRTLLHVHVADPQLAQRRAQQPQPLAGLLGRAQVGLGDDLRQRRAAAVEVHDARVRAVDAPAGAGVRRAWPRPPRGARGGCAPHPGARRGTAARRTGRSGSPWAGPDRSSSCDGRSSAARAPSRAPGRSSARSAPRARWPPAGCPGSPRQTGQVRVLGGSPKDSSQPQNIFVAVASWTWISRPMTVSYATVRCSAATAARARAAGARGGPAPR